MGIGDAVRLRIIGLCEERKISINKLCSISGVTQSTINNIVSGRRNCAMVLESPLLTFSTTACFLSLSRKFAKALKHA